MMQSLSRCWSIVPMMALSACSTLGLQQFQDPTIEVHRILVRNVTLVGGTLDVEVRVRNPNSYAIRATRLAVDLRVAGTPIGEIIHDAAFELPKAGTTPMTLPFDFRWDGVGAATRAAVLDGRFAYDFAGTVRVRTSFGERDVVFHRDGVVDFTPSRLGRSTD